MKSAGKLKSYSSVYNNVPNPKYGWHEKVSAEAKGRARPGWELLYNHYAKVKGMNAPYSQAFAEKERPEGYGERGTAEELKWLSKKSSQIG